VNRRRLWHTIRWLRPSQFIWRLRYRFFRPGIPPGPSLDDRTAAVAFDRTPVRCDSFGSDGTPRFLNLNGSIDQSTDWTDGEESRLWLYNLHYFDYLISKDASVRPEFYSDLIHRWIDECPPGSLVGWEPYPTSLRIVNWIKWLLPRDDVQKSAMASLALQAAWLEKNIEWHLLGNHLFANAKALVFAGLFFYGDESDGDDAGRWLRRGLSILEREIPEQVLPDGGQFELSPMYHSIATADVLDLINISRAYPGYVSEAQIEEWTSAATNMLAWADVMKHPDGRIVLFNDSAFSIALNLAEIFAYAERLGIDWQQNTDSLVILPDTGYMRARNEHACLFTDFAEIGPDYLPGHAHADTLNFELSLFGERWIVDSGCSTYEVCDERLRQRGTAAHNTVTVDNEDSAEVWSSFRVARRGRPVDIAAGQNEDVIRISGGHDGYMRLKGRVMHYREFQLNDHQLQIVDDLTGEPRSAAANFLLHPDVSVSRSEDGFDLSRGNYHASLSFDGGKAEVADATWHPEFGLSIPTHRISVTMSGSSLVTVLRWTPAS
jgi:uncharacterized heparinase superfamily protein